MPWVWNALRVTDTATRIPFVDYLVLGGDPHLVASECTEGGARFFDRRNACASGSASRKGPFLLTRPASLRCPG